MAGRSEAGPEIERLVLLIAWQLGEAIQRAVRVAGITTVAREGSETRRQREWRFYRSNMVGCWD